MRVGSRFFVALAALFASAVHFAKTPEHLTIAAWLGALFIIDAVAFVVLAAWLLVRPGRIPQLLISLLGAGTAVGYLISRTAGLPGVSRLPWDGLGITVSVVEVILAVIALLGARREASSSAAETRRAA